jgi:hypothetical protein
MILYVRLVWKAHVLLQSSCCLLGKVLVWSEAMDAEGEKLKLWYCPNHTLDWTNVPRPIMQNYNHPILLYPRE